MCKAIYGVLVLAALGAVVFSASSAWADKGGNSHKAERAEKPAAAKKHHDSEKQAEETVFGFNDKEVEAISAVLKHLYGGDDAGTVEIVRPSRSFCPPGLAKKNNGCLPPGLAKKYSLGAPLPDDVTYTDLPQALLDVLGAPPKGKKYVQVDKDVLLISEGTKLVLDAIGVGGQ